jgi:HlyD family secretion protein
MKWGRIAVIGVVVLAAAGGLWWAFAPQPVAVDTVAVAKGDLLVTVDEEGLAKVRDVYEIAAPISGELLRIAVEVGDAVAAGAVVATLLPMESALLDPRSRAEAEAAVRAAEDAVTSAQSDLTIARSEQDYWQAEAERKELLLEKGFTTLQVVQQARLELARRASLIANAEAALEMRQHQLEQAEARLLQSNPAAAVDTRRDVLAPAPGEVLRIDNDSGRSVAAGTPLMQIGQPDDLEIVVDLLSADAVRIDAGAPATVSGWGGDQELTARVSRIEPTGFTKVSALGVEEQRVLVHLDLLDPPESRPRLGHLYRVFVRIEAQHVAGALLVPTSALFRTDNRWSAFVVEEGKARLRQIDIGARNAEMAEVLEGIAAGAIVIVHPSDQIVDGSLVKPR